MAHVRGKKNWYYLKLQMWIFPCKIINLPVLFSRTINAEKTKSQMGNSGLSNFQQATNFNITYVEARYQRKLALKQEYFQLLESCCLVLAHKLHQYMDLCATCLHFLMKKQCGVKHYKINWIPRILDFANILEPNNICSLLEHVE